MQLRCANITVKGPTLDLWGLGFIKDALREKGIGNKASCLFRFLTSSGKGEAAVHCCQFLGIYAA